MKKILIMAMLATPPVKANELPWLPVVLDLVLSDSTPMVEFRSESLCKETIASTEQGGNVFKSIECFDSTTLSWIDKSQICKPFLQQCRFNGNKEGCRAIKTTPEQGRIDDNRFVAFSCASFSEWRQLSY